jgi:hypothetical protein
MFKEKNIIGKDDREYTILKDLQLTNAQKQLPESYEPGQVIICHQNIKGVRAGKKMELVGSNANGIEAKDGRGNIVTINYKHSEHMSVYESKTIAIAKGDKIRITNNCKTLDDTHLFNGYTYIIKGFDRQGNIKLSNGSTIAQDLGHFNLGYVSTSPSAQGKTMEKVIISQSSATFKATSMQQFYVSASRGVHAISVYTDNKQELKHAISKSLERMSATELVTKANSHRQDTIRMQQTIHNNIHKINGHGLQDKTRTR